MREALMWLVVHRVQWAPDVLLASMVVAMTLNIHAFFQQRRMLAELRRLLLRVRQDTIARRPMVLTGVGHRHYVAPRVVGGEADAD